MIEMTALNQPSEKMSKLVYFDCPTGIAGDMCLGALLDLGVPLSYLQERLAGLGITQEFQLICEPAHRQGQRATQAWVKTVSQHHHRRLSDIQSMIQSANLPERSERWSMAVFNALASAEGKVHGIDPASVHFHEVGAVDAIVDIVGTCLGLDWLNVDGVYCSTLPTGGGTVRAAHGQLSVPVPAVLELFAQHSVPVYHNGIDRELVTPTGAAIAVTLAQSFGPPPSMKVQKIGIGSGQAELALPNALRMWLGEADEFHGGDKKTERIVVLETQVDDMTPQGIGYLFEVLLAAGALDVLTQTVGMKKSRPGILIQVFCHRVDVDTCEDILFRETSTLGVRRRIQERRILARRQQVIETPFGSVQIKIAYAGDRIFNVQPEYEDCVRIAQQHHMPWRDVYQWVLNQWTQEQRQSQSTINEIS